MRALLTIVALALSGASPVPAAPTILGEFPGAFLENLTRAEDGRLVVTSYFDRRLLIGSAAEGGFATLATLPAHPVGIEVTPDGYIVTAHGASFAAGAAFMSTNRILLLDRTGKVTRDVAVPKAMFLNGLVKLGDGWLIADSVAATIWRFDPVGGAVTPWLVDPSLAGTMAKGGRPGANGLKLRGGALYVSNSARGTIDMIKLTADGRPAAAPQPFARPGAVDDFAFGEDGTTYVATHAAQLLAVAPDGTKRVLMATGCDSCTALALDGDAAIVLTTGNRFEGGKLPGRILRVPATARDVVSAAP